MRIAIATCLTIGLLLGPIHSRADHSLVLIVSNDSTLQDISAIDLRKLYLGFTVATDNGRPIRALSNFSDPKVWEIFLQDVMGMSDRSYNRRLLTLTLQSGRPRPAVHQKLDELLDHVKSDRNAVSFAWAEDVENHEDIRILRILWHH